MMKINFFILCLLLILLVVLIIIINTIVILFVLFVFHHHHHRFASVSMLAWIGRGLIRVLLHNLRSWAGSRLSFILLRPLFINWDHVFLGLPYSRLPSTTTCLQALAGLPAFILITCPNHLSLFLRSTSVMSGIPSLSLNLIITFNNLISTVVIIIIYFIIIFL